MTMAGPAPWEQLEDQEMVGNRMWALETAADDFESASLL